jgi:glyoxylase-like metal-dependent hydrolase (beta-lactamase superfamily II)
MTKPTTGPTIGHDDSGLNLPTHAPLVFPIETPPAFGEFIQVAPEIYWLRGSMPMVLNHINVYLIKDGDGWTVLDTGIATPAIQGAWRNMIAQLGGPIKRVIVTHYHPDHVGNAGWFQREYGAPLWMSRTEILMARYVTSPGGPMNANAPEAETFYRAAGFNDEQIEAYKERRTRGFGFMSEELPYNYHRIQDGEKIMINGTAWEVVVGRGHSPEHACLYSAHHKVLFSGDQVLPNITTNVSVMPSEPEANPLKEWIDSLTAIRDRLPDDVLVLPAHNRPFYGLHARLTALIDGHEKNLRELHALCEQPKRAIDVFGVLFKRKIDNDVLFMATGESYSHINCLVQRGKLAREVDANGVSYFRQTDAKAARGMKAAE